MGYGVKQDLICRHDDAGVEENGVPHARLCRPCLDIVGADDQFRLDSRGLAPDGLELLFGQGDGWCKEPDNLRAGECQSEFLGCSLKAQARQLI